MHGFTEPDAQVRELAAKLTKGKTTRDEKLRALFDFVADDIRYVNYVSGEWWLPNRPQQLLARREGDCDDKAHPPHHAAEGRRASTRRRSWCRRA